MQRGPRRGRSPIRSIGLANTTGNQEQVAALPRRQRLISVPYRSAATPPKAAQRPQRGVWHQNGGAQPHNRSPLPRAGEASQTSPGGETSVPEGQKIRSIPQSPRLAPRRAGVPNFAGWRNFRARRATIPPQGETTHQIPALPDRSKALTMNASLETDRGGTAHGPHAIHKTKA